MTVRKPMRILPIHVQDLHKRFDGKTVLRGVNLDVAPGQVVGLLGRNGSGKTTLIKCILGLLRPSSGGAAVYGDDAWHLAAGTKARIGYVPQEVVSYPWMRVRHVIQYTAAFYPKWNDSLVERLCRQWRLPLHDRVGVLSTGQRQIMASVLALGHEPDLLVLDEPVASLDPAARHQFLRTLLATIERPGVTVLFSSHITSDLERVASHVAMLRDGTIRVYCELDELKDRVKRISITAAAPLPAELNIPHCLHCKVDGNSATATVDRFSLQVIQQLRDRWHANVSVHDLNLEEIFLELHNGRGQ